MKKLLGASSPLDISADLLMLAINSTYQDNLLNELQKFIEFIARGEANKNIRYVIAGAELIVYAQLLQ